MVILIPLLESILIYMLWVTVRRGWN